MRGKVYSTVKIILVAILAVMGLPTLAVDPGKGPALLSALEARKLDETLNVLNQIKQSRQRADVLPVLLDLWNNDKRNYPNLHWDFVNLDLIRINVADVLVQAYRNTQIEVDRKGIHEYVAKVAIESGDKQARANAIVVLGIIDSARDVPFLKATALREKDSTAIYALTSLGMMCNASAGAALADLSKTGENKTLEERAKVARDSRLETIKSNVGWCARRAFR